MLKSKLEEFNIFALREFARQTGVKSPTSKKKEQLIKEITEILSGAKKPEVSNSKQGRPPKNVGYDVYQVFGKFQEIDVSKQKLNQDVKVAVENELVTVAGWLELLNNNAGMLWVEKDLVVDKYFIPTHVLKNYHLKMGDRLVAEVSVDETQKVVKEIYSINDNPIMKLPAKRVDYLSIKHNLPSRNLKFKSEEFDALNLMYGENVYVYGNDNNHNTVKVVEMLKNCDIANKLYVNISVAEKNKIHLKDLKYFENFVANITDEISVASRLVMLAIERAKRAIENGEDVLVVVDDVTSILGLEKVGLDLIKNLISIAKEGKEKGSITVVAVIPNSGIYQIEKLADKRLQINNEKITIL